MGTSSVNTPKTTSYASGSWMSNGQLNLAIPPYVGVMSRRTGDGHSHRWGRKQQVMRNSRPCYQNCWNWQAGIL